MNMQFAYDILELFCEFVYARVPILETQRDCPQELQEAIASIIFAAPRCSDLPELLQIRNLFTTKLLKEIAKEYNLDWDASSTEAEFRKKHEDLLDGLIKICNGATDSRSPIEKGFSNMSVPRFLDHVFLEQVLSISLAHFLDSGFFDQVLVADMDKLSHPLAEPWEELVHLVQKKDTLGKSRYLKHTSQDTEHPDLGSVRVVVTGGRALKSPENFRLLEKLAEKLGAGVGATRDAVDTSIAKK
ncbi:hypothetical protein IFM89_001212 [Coptis chinensis]|uniref:Electron transfer flavoprotein alpha subunit C-terminal domain-containing protein n=1 Tax=Coptis chinensis TaxID=261450 RepID=A0A835H3C8_9MAGN|nr:hypothetical protein IFM89_001212 [Coptis chinensis]